MYRKPLAASLSVRHCRCSCRLGESKEEDLTQTHDNVLIILISRDSYWITPSIFWHIFYMYLLWLMHFKYYIHDRYIVLWMMAMDTKINILIELQHLSRFPFHHVRSVILEHPSSWPTQHTCLWWARFRGWLRRWFRACLCRRLVTLSPMVWWVISRKRVKWNSHEYTAFNIKILSIIEHLNIYIM